MRLLQFQCGYASPRLDEELAYKQIATQDQEKHDDESLESQTVTMSTYTRLTQSSQVERLTSCVYLSLNIASSVLLVFVNRRVFNDARLQQMQSSIAAFHLLCTFTLLYASTLPPSRIFPAIRLPFRAVAPLCVLFISFLLLNNLSITLNSVGVYQMSKHMAIPTVVLLEYLLASKAISVPSAIALLYVGAGVILTDSGVTSLTVAGGIVAIAAFTVTALYQVFISRKLKQFSSDVSSPQLLLNQAPWACLMVLVLVPFTDRPWTLDLAAIQPDVYIWLGLSGLLAAVFNLSQFLVIGQTSALTFNVAGSAKTIIIVITAWVLEARAVTVAEASGLMLGVIGALAYSQLP